MVDAFATTDDLSALLNRSFTTDEQAWISTLLENASTYLRGVIEQQVYPRTTSTYTDYPLGGRVDMLQWPVVSVDSVQRDGLDVAFKYRPGYIYDITCDDPVDITFTWGYATPPEELKRLACVLVSGALLTLEAGIGLTAGGLSSVALDDFKAAWADGGSSSGMVLPDVQVASVRQQFGRGGFTIVESR